MDCVDGSSADREQIRLARLQTNMESETLRTAQKEKVTSLSLCFVHAPMGTSQSGGVEVWVVFITMIPVLVDYSCGILSFGIVPNL